MNSWRITTRMLFIALAPLAVVVVALSVHYTTTRINEIEAELDKRGTAIARQLAPSCEYGVVTGNREFLLKLADAGLREADVTGITVKDADGRLLARAGTVDIRRHRMYRAPIHQYEISPDDYQSPPTPSRPGGSSSTIVGWVEVVLSTEQTRARQTRVLLEGAIIGILALVVTGLITLWMARGVTQPIQKLTRAVRKIEQGHLDERISLQAGGELGNLEQGINAMASSLAQADRRQRRLAEDRLSQERMRAQVTLESIAEGVISTDNSGHIVYMNSAAQEYTGCSPDEVVGYPLGKVIRILDETTDAPREYPIDQCLHNGSTIRQDTYRFLVRNDGRRIPIKDTASPIRDTHGSLLGAVLVFNDVTTIQHNAYRMSYLATHDSLTGLTNRTEFETRLRKALDSSKAHGTNHVLCYLDLARFKTINDSCGHAAGDELLRQLATRIQQPVRHTDLVARIGGDEFAILLWDCDQASGRALAENIQKAVTEFHFVWHDQTFQVGACIGIVPITPDSGGMAKVLGAADSACYLAKEQGETQIFVLDPAEDTSDTRHESTQWELQLRNAISGDLLEFYCQPIVRLNGFGERVPRGYELLPRLRKDQQLIWPATFIAHAERYYLLPDLDRKVILQAIQLLERSAEFSDTETPFISVNVSAQSIDDESFERFIVGVVSRTNIEPSRLCLEITENAAATHLTRTAQFIDTVKKAGCQIAIDDFGSRLSSFGYLKNLDVDILKISETLLHGVIDDLVDLSMVQSINQIAHVMGFTTVAECVDSEAVLQKVADLGMDYAQGFAIAHPSPVVDLFGDT